MYQYAAQNRHATGNFRLRYRVLLIAVILLLAATVVLAAVSISGNSFKAKSREQYTVRMPISRTVRTPACRSRS